ncbi:RNA-directed DNA polymerase, eukaryota, reverse transcriptase zinc-binding domain protein [Tanacetum coccineum]
MVRNTSTIQDTNGWHWKFKVNKKESTIPIRNPFQNEVEKIASFFYITNFPNYVDAKRLWLECESYGRIVNAFIPNKRSKAGKRFGFVRFIGGKNEERLASSLASIWIGSYHLFASVARFNRQEKKDVLLKKVVENKVDRQEPKKKQPTLSDQELVQISDSQAVALVKACNAFKSNNTLKSFFSSVKSVSKNFYVDERMVWVEISGLPLCAWGSNAYKKVASLMGKFMFFDNDSSTAISLGRELGSWSINLDDMSHQDSDTNSYVDLESNKEKKAESESDEEEEIQKAILNIKESNDTTNDQQENSYINANNVVGKEETLEFQTERMESSNSSDGSQPPGISVIHKLSRLIEVGDKLGYDVKGCHKSLHRLIDRIGVSMVDKLRFYLLTFEVPRNGENVFGLRRGRWASSDNLFFMINIYGPHKTADKITLWNRLLEFIRNHECHFVLFRDLNEVRDECERYGTEFHRPSANNFNSFINDADILELPLGGRNFTWMNKADHTPIMLHCNKVDFAPIPFKFFHSWLQRDGFDDCIKKAYKECSLINPKMAFHEKLKCLKQNIKEWNRKSISIIASRKHEVLSKLTDIEDKIDSNTASDIDKEDRVKLLKERDGIQQLEDIKRDKFDVSDSSIELSPVIPPSTLSQNDNLELEKPVSDEEIWLAVWDCGSQKAPGPDDFSFLFLKTYWELLKEDVVKDVRNVFDSFVMPIGANSSFITLIPKILNPIHIKDFRPISLVGLQYKIIAIILANRLLKVIDKVVSNKQSAFISGRYILDGPLMLSEIMSWYKKKKINMLPFKVDFEKAFDSFPIKRGLCQGDPLSPFLFIIIMEGLQYKIIAIILANRLLKVIDKVVSNKQSAFISGRYILDGPLMLSAKPKRQNRTRNGKAGKDKVKVQAQA